ncbi:MAG: flagellar assembly protein FliH [Gammaproteobacteria bacterium]|nr:flagellar assembly protein FliH [Gammaproteobacteria bacterium]
MTLSNVITKDKLGDAKRWSMPGVDAAKAPQRDLNVKDYIEGLAALGGKLPTSRDLEKLQQQAYTEGYQAGHAEGLQAAELEIQQSIEWLRNTLKALESPMQDFDQNVKQELAQLAIAIAKQVIKAEIKQNPEDIVSIVNEAIDAVPPGSNRLHIHLNPADVAKAQEHLQQKNATTAWDFVADAAITRGGCKVFGDTACVDCTLEVRIAKIAAKFLDIAEEDNNAVGQLSV